MNFHTYELCNPDSNLNENNLQNTQTPPHPLSHLSLNNSKKFQKSNHLSLTPTNHHHAQQTHPIRYQNTKSSKSYKHLTESQSFRTSLSQRILEFMLSRLLSSPATNAFDSHASLLPLLPKHQPTHSHRIPLLRYPRLPTRIFHSNPKSPPRLPTFRLSNLDLKIDRS